MGATLQFQKMVDSGKPVGEVIGVERFLIKVRGLQPTNTHAIILFEDGSKGFVHHVYEDYVVVLHLGEVTLQIGTIAVVQHDRLVTRVGKNYIGRVVNVLGDPLDGKGPIEADGTWPVFHNAPMLYERELLDQQLESGVITLDILFSIVRGQRMALLGDSKSGKSVLATQIAINQRDTDIITIYVLIGKRRFDLIELIDRLETNKAMHKTIVVASTMFESLVLNYLAPYVGAAMGEYLWQQCDADTLVIYDDLTGHAMAYREISLIAGVSPGRDSYPGDMFYAHSQLVERAGRLNRNHATQTIIPIIYAPGGDITAYLPTNVMSMTDGQWILDMEVFKQVMRPAVSTGMSVTRVGGVGQNKRQKGLGVATSKALAAHRQAEEYAHFGSELSDESAADLERGKNLYRLFNQIVGETYNFMEQQFLLDIIINLEHGESIDIDELKKNVHEYATQVANDDDEEKSNFNELREALKNRCMVEAAEKDAKKKVEAVAKESDNEQAKDEAASNKAGSSGEGKELTEPAQKIEQKAESGESSESDVSEAEAKDKPAESAGKPEEKPAEKSAEADDTSEAKSDKKSTEEGNKTDEKSDDTKPKPESGEAPKADESEAKEGESEGKDEKPAESTEAEPTPDEGKPVVKDMKRKLFHKRKKS